MREYFGTDGVRGIANIELTAELALRLGAAAAKVLLTRPHGVSVLIGRDPRISGDMLEGALAAGFASRGADVVLVGVIPTPGVACLVRKTDADVGAVISASHNPMDYNGIKFFGPDGEKLPDETEHRIEQHLFDEPSDLPTGASIGRYYRQPERVELYVEEVKETCRTSLDGLKLVVDGANGAASEIAPRLLRELGAKVVSINCDPDGENINDRCGSMFPTWMQEVTTRERADAGLSFDGDADRVLMATEDGSLVDGEHLMAICAIQMAARGALPGGRVVTTPMSDMGLEVALQKHGLTLDRVTEVGDRYVAERMRETGAMLGEKSGHIILRQHTTTGDGLVTALEVLQAMNATGKPLSELASVMTNYPQILRGVPVKSKDGWRERPAIAEAIANGERLLAGWGRLHVRASGTEPKIRVMAEGPSAAELEIVVSIVCDAILRELA